MTVTARPSSTATEYVHIRDTQAFADFRIIVYRHKRYSEMGPYPGHHAFGNLIDYQS